MQNYNSRPNVKIEGVEGEENEFLVRDIQQICVEESLNLPDAFTIILHNPFTPGDVKDKHHWLSHPALKVGAKIKFGFRSTTTMAGEFSKQTENPALLEGEITGIEAHYTEDPSAPVVLRGYDMSHRLHRGRYNRSFINMTDSDIVRKIIGEVGLQAGEIEDSGAPHDYVFQENQTNMAFLRDRASRIGFELYVQDSKVHFHKPKSDGEADTLLQWGKRLQSFRTRMTAAEQVKSVEVRSWDYKEKKAIVGTAEAPQLVTQTGYTIAGKADEPFGTNAKLTVVDHPVFSPEEADIMAQAVCDEMGGEGVYADARCEGEPTVRPGKIVNLTQMGDQHSGKYYVTDARHFYHDNVYTTEFSVRGTRGGNMMSNLGSQPKLKPGQTNLVGIVTNNKDPEGMGRIKVKFPTLTEEHESNWARVVGPGAGPEHGIWWLPEVNDEVLVCFEHGDIHRPYVVGGVWNGKDKPPDKQDDSVTPVHLRTMKTRVGHYMRMVDEDTSPDKVGIYLRTKKMFMIEMNETDEFINIKTPGGHYIKLNDQDGSIEIHSTGELNINSQGSTTINASGNMSVSSSGPMTIQGAQISIN
ncbi:VgrG-related protein [Gloeobacter kilaueensis]|uniref:Gp5/Type VI secretion system Vgr protein OB-fold domain-containing protein n=1 Tax=Gloeobacter kilaueensis (strain ATCC BAA-2537 / CCAP 1431/1 / ULC 316 / JS1) TaxID=1183438 RepID=U5QMV1_GLOK1|nr:VgrG-related protein [Gloeobacter kilaueensis]AGY58919.1 hypothetical protein GKIL_2673 [Gloeobacter kilaueensis JS1]